MCGNASRTFIRRAANVSAAPTRYVPPASIARAPVDMAWVTSSSAGHVQRIVLHGNIVKAAVARVLVHVCRAPILFLLTRPTVCRVPSIRTSADGYVNQGTSRAATRAGNAAMRTVPLASTALAHAATALATVSSALIVREIVR